MKTYLNFLIILFLPFNQACSQSLGEEIVGKWGLALVQENNGQKIAVECPDFLQFFSDGTYTIFNDCEMHMDNRQGIIEKGKWGLDSQQIRIRLSDRDFTNLKFSEYTFHGKKESLVLIIDQISENELWFCIDDGYDCPLEKYERKKTN